MGTQGDDNSPHTEANLSRDFEEFESNRATVSLSQFRLSDRSDGATLASRRRQTRKTTDAVDYFHASWVEVRSLNKSS